MAPKSFVYLAGAAVLSALLAIFTFASSNQWGGRPVGGERLMPALETSVGKVAEVSIQQGFETVVLQREGDKWSLKSRGGYPVDVDKVRTLLVALGQAELAQAKTKLPKNYAVLELEDPAKKDAKSRLVKLTDAQGKTIAEAVLGKTRSKGYGTASKAGTYVRRPGEAQTWLTNVEIAAPLATKDWVKTSVLALKADKIDGLSIEIPGEEPLRIERPAPAAAPKPAAKDAKTEAKVVGADAIHAEAEADEAKRPKKTKPPAPPAKLAFVDFPADGKKLKDARAARAIARAVASIDLEDVRKLDTTPIYDVSTVKLETADGLTATLRLREEGDAHWLSLTAAGTGDAKKTADEIVARTKGWEFKISDYKADSILKKRADLIEKSES